MMYFHPTVGKDNLFNYPIVITNREDYEAFLDKLLAVKLVKHSTRRRQDTSWGLHSIVNILSQTRHFLGSAYHCQYQLLRVYHIQSSNKKQSCNNLGKRYK